MQYFQKKKGFRFVFLFFFFLYFSFPMHSFAKGSCSHFVMHALSNKKMHGLSIKTEILPCLSKDLNPTLAV